MIDELDIDESKGEILCDECNGKGSVPSSPNKNYRVYRELCWKCQGDGKVDWVSNATGKPEKKLKGIFSSSSVSSMSSTSGPANNIYNDMIDSLAQNMAAEIDKEILDSLNKQSNKHINDREGP